MLMGVDKVDKEKRKYIKQQFEKEFKKEMKGRGYKFRNGCAFKRIDQDNFVYGGHIFVPMDETGNFAFDWNIKKYSYDDIFWEIINMEKNSNEPDSLRAIGAFKASGIRILDMKVKLEDNVEAFIKDLIVQIEEATETFLNETSVNEYVISHEGFFDEKILKVLAYIDMEMKDKALELAEKEVSNGNTGRFENEGKGFFEWTCKKLGKRSSLVDLLKSKLKMLSS